MNKIQTDETAIEKISRRDHFNFDIRVIKPQEL